MSPRNKFGAVPTTVEGIRFASKAEAARYRELLNLQRAQHIDSLVCHPRYQLSGGASGEKVCTYEADFRYFDLRDGRTIVEDVKGVETPVFRLKKKLMKACHGIDVVVVPAGRVKR